MSILRVIDANANRAREAIRVAEDIARFILEREDLARDCKALRHDLQSALTGAGLDPVALLACRDTPTDVGTTITTPTETHRQNAAHIAAAATARLTESLRTLEESLKLTSPGSSDIEPLRYRAYELEKRLRIALAGARAAQWPLCVLITEELCTDHPWLHVAALALEGGATCFQLREKNLTDRDLLHRARTLIEIARPAGASVFINDRPDIALAANADGVHLGQTDLPIELVRRQVGSGLLIGATAATLDHAAEAAAAGADVIGLGPMFPSTTKPKPSLSGPDLLTAYLARPDLARIPHLAISGIDAKRAATLAAIGCKGVAVSAAVCSSEDPRAAAADIIQALQTP